MTYQGYIARKWVKSRQINYSMWALHFKRKFYWEDNCNTSALCQLWTPWRIWARYFSILYFSNLLCGKEYTEKNLGGSIARWWTARTLFTTSTFHSILLNISRILALKSLSASSNIWVTLGLSLFTALSMSTFSYFLTCLYLVILDCILDIVHNYMCLVLLCSSE